MKIVSRILIPLALFFTFIIIYAVLIQSPFHPINSITKIVSAIQEIPANNESIIVDDELDCPSAKDYSQDYRPVFCKKSDSLDIALKSDKVWFITKNNASAKTYDDYNLPNVLSGYVIISDVINGKIVALELEKTEK